MQEQLRLDTAHLEGFVTDKDLEDIFPEVEKAHTLLAERNGPGKDLLGWMDIPENIDERVIKDIEETAAGLNSNSDAVIIIGIGGSYLGARAAIEALSPGSVDRKVFFAGHNLSGDYLGDLLETLKDRDISVNVISKSGTTTEPAVAFRIVEDFLKKKYGPGRVRDRIVCTTDSEKGALRARARKEGYRSFVIPDDVGGRFSVLTPVGLLPAACAGINVRDLIAGAKEQRLRSVGCDLSENMSYRYAAARNVLYRGGKRIEVLSNFDDRLHYLGEWWKQLFGESEGKNGRCIFPASCDFSADLHSMGQLIQEGERNLFETFFIVEKDSGRCPIPRDDEDMDELNYLAGKQVDYVNRKAYEATAKAHFEGGVPNSTVLLAERSAFCLGQLFYFFEKAAAVSGYLSGVNPFDQPGVDSYKQKMFKLLGKPGIK
ncbi:MAG: glucose-6-phosphate isomerase [Candidatus Makaraimicrobium thalassicum]|nr:MAG: glucose-6-phosphate isomerase [Candidatus Omnitrophota bacterium]